MSLSRLNGLRVWHSAGRQRTPMEDPLKAMVEPEGPSSTTPPFPFAMTFPPQPPPDDPRAHPPTHPPKDAPET